MIEHNLAVPTVFFYGGLTVVVKLKFAHSIFNVTSNCPVHVSAAYNNNNNTYL